MNIKTIKQKLGMDGHHHMESFAVFFIAFVFVLSMFTGAAIKINADKKKYKMTGNTVLSYGAPWSKTGTNLNVTGFYRNKSGTKALVWLKMDDMKMLSTDPETYSVYINPYKNQDLTHPISGALYLYGDTGNMALVLTDNAVFENTCVEVILRSKPVYENPSFENPYTDPSFINNNQVQFNINCGGSDAIIVDFLDDSTLDPRKMYYRCALDYPIRQAQVKLNEEMLKIRDDAAMVESYRSRLIDYGFVIPALPAAVTSDFVSASPINIVGKPIEFDETMFDLDSAIISTTYGTAEGDDVAMTGRDGERYYYVSDFVYPGGINVNINDTGSLQEIFDTLKPSDMTYMEWRESKFAESRRYNVSNTYRVDNDAWQLNSRIYQIGTNDMYDTAINQYVNAVSQLMSDKQTYQTKDIYEIFDYVSELDTVADNVRLNANQGLVTVWKKYK